MDSNRTGVLTIVATPIGNLNDMVPRAIQTLHSVSLIACEDTRHSKKLLNHFNIDKPCIAYHDHGDRQTIEKLLVRLESGEDIALISDAGTPLISDPGYRLVAQARNRGITVTPIPGACAAIAALSVSGLPTDSFLFGGFLPAKTGQRKTTLNEFKPATQTLVFYEAPHRILETVTDMVEIFGQQRQGFLAREISKTFETFIQGTLSELQQQISLDTNQQRGEIVLVIAGAEEKTATTTVSAEKVLKLLLNELPASKAASLTAKICGADKKAMYQVALQFQGK
ncbi:MAG: 16S rRNA (cytidine(1402)-2'-O)-methyltransferase [Cellvibrionales bacterium TMED47]|nr:16S rRNA (cytidine(1402)-2'-O)-methyltransferase [Porticoccaceae bacterium]RPG83247.1 MAG: 16S rRNA (cytidine(1402)-2'-O)-methyltransferase [Cellvibrionales bacterium TMED47]